MLELIKNSLLIWPRKKTRPGPPPRNDIMVQEKIIKKSKLHFDYHFQRVLTQSN